MALVVNIDLRYSKFYFMSSGKNISHIKHLHSILIQQTEKLYIFLMKIICVLGHQ